MPDNNIHKGNDKCHLSEGDTSWLKENSAAVSPLPSNYLLLSHFTDSKDESRGKWTHNYAHLSYINTAS